jgi:hypothetical protein
VSSVPSEILACYAEAEQIAAQRLPYVFGGGHGPGFGPTGGGYDCSGAASAVLRAGGILEHPSGPLDTRALERWGLPGVGERMTLHVINRPEIQHCVLEFLIPGRHKWFAASHTGTIVGWLAHFDATGYVARRRKA